MKKLIILSVLVSFSLGAKAQQRTIAVHPGASELVSALQSISVVINRIDRPLSALSNEFDSKQISIEKHNRRIKIGQLATQWASIITVSNGKETPTASDLFLFFTELQDIESDCTELTREGRFIGKDSTVISNATFVIKTSIELLPVMETIKYATADRIESQETACLKPSKSVRH